MGEVILKVENLSKQYRLGLVGTGTLSHDLNRWWHRVRGKEDPYLKIGETNDRSQKGQSEYVWALKDINFEVKRGEVLGIIGKNGAGKSTLLKILSKVTSPTTGSVKTRGRIASLLEVGTGFHGEMTGRENIYLNGAILGMTKKEIASKIDEIIDFSGCARYIDTPVKRYSSGMTVRLAFAVAAFLEPDILIVDEVLAVGDAEFQKKAIAKIQHISKGKNSSVILVSHNMSTILSLCERVIILENGISQKNNKLSPVKVVEHYLKRNAYELETVIDSKQVKCKVYSKFNYDLFETFSFHFELEKIVKDRIKLRIDWALIDMKGNYAMHYRMAVAKKYILLNDKKSNVQIEMINPGILPGNYSLTIHISDEFNNVLYWAKNVLIIVVKDSPGKFNFNKEIKSSIFPEVTLTINDVYV